MLNVKKTFALAIISLFIGLIAYSTAASITSSTNATNGTNFTLNLSGQPAMDNFSTIVCGVNMTCSQNSTPDNHTIFINSLGAGGGGSGTVTQLNQGAGITLSPNPITTTGTIKINGSACNPANQASVLNGSGGLECVSNIDTGIGAEVDPFSVHWNVFANAVHNNESETQFNANYSNIVNVTNNSYVLINQTWSRQNTTIDINVNFSGFQALAMAVENNASFPTKPNFSQFFVHNTTGRKILFMYNGVAWTPIISMSETTFYVDPEQGTDNQTQGTDTFKKAFKTLQYAINQIPPINTGSVVIYVGGGISAESVIVQGKYYSGNFNISIYGNTTQLLNGIASSGIKGATTQQATVSNSTASWGVNQYKNKLIHFTSGSNNDKYRIIDGNNATMLTLVGETLSATPANLDTFEILDWNTTISKPTSGGNTFLVFNGQQAVHPYRLHFNNSGGGTAVGLIYSGGSSGNPTQSWVSDVNVGFRASNPGTFVQVFNSLYTDSNAFTGQAFSSLNIGFMLVQGSKAERTNAITLGTSESGMNGVRIAYMSPRSSVIQNFSTGLLITENSYTLFTVAGSSVYNQFRNATTAVSITGSSAATGASNNVYVNATLYESFDTSSYLDGKLQVTDIGLGTSNGNLTLNYTNNLFIQGGIGTGNRFLCAYPNGSIYVGSTIGCP